MSVIVLSGVPPNCHEGDVRRSLLMFGTALEVKVNPQRKEAIVTLSSPSEAQTVIQQQQIKLMGCAVQVRAYIPHVNGGRGGHHQPPQGYGGGGWDHPPPPHQGGPYMSPPHGMPSNRLSIVVENCLHPITRDVLMQMFHSNLAPGQAPPRNVYCGPSDTTTYGEVEFMDVASAEKAVRDFNGRSIYPDCCHVRLTYKPMQGLLPQPYAGGGGMPLAEAQGFSPYYAPQQPQAPMPYRGRGGGRGGMYGGGRGMMMPAGPAPPMQPGGMPPRGFPPGRQAAPETAVMITGVMESIPLYDLWVLLEVYGNVYSLKRQFKDKTNVVAMFQHLADAQCAVEYLRGVSFRGGVLALKIFRNYIDNTRPDEWDKGDAKDPSTVAVNFRTGYHHSTNPQSPFNMYGRVQVSNNLFLFNLIDDITDDEVKQLFTCKGFEIADYYRKNSASAVVAFANTDVAIDALIAVQGEGNKVKERFLRISFSRIPPGPKPAAAPNAEGDATESKEEEGAVTAEAAAEEGNTQAEENNAVVVNNEEQEEGAAENASTAQPPSS